MSTADTSPIRRSSRPRKKTDSYYDEAAKAVLLEEQKRKDLKILDDDNEEEEVNDNDQPMTSDDESDNNDDDDEDTFHPEGDSQPKKKKASKKKMTTPAAKKRSKKSPSSLSSAKKITKKNNSKHKKSPKRSPAIVKRGNNKKRGSPIAAAAAGTKKSSSGATVTVKNAFTKTRISQALTMLSKRVLAVSTDYAIDDNQDDDLNAVKKQETPETSLVAALLASAKAVNGIPSTTRPKTYYYAQQQQQLDICSGGDPTTSSTTTSQRMKRTNSIITVCLPQLDGIVRHLIRTTEHEGPHEMHVKLLNLLFRSVGGSVETNIPSGTDLDELEDDDWDDLISKVVTVMKNESTADQTLLCADDDDDIGIDHNEDDDFDSDNNNNSKSNTSNGAGAGTRGSTTATLTTRQIGAIVYRTVYKEFWYRLGHVLLAHSPSPAVAMVSSEEDSDNDDDDDNDNDKTDEEDDHDSDDDEATENSDGDSIVDDDDSLFSSKKKKRKLRPSSSQKSKANKKRKKSNNVTTKKKSSPQQQGGERFSSNRFQLEKVRDLILRMTELVSVGQPDVRAAGTIAVLQLAKACVERTVELEQKIRVASRQLKVAFKAGSKRKQQTLQHHLDNWKRHKAELQEMVEVPVFQGVFIHRYRDANDRIRRDCLRSLSSISLIRPDIFLFDTYLKYFGWMASDKSASVRIAALEGLSAPFRAAAAATICCSSSSNPSTSPSTAFPYPIDVASMQNVTNKFLSRIVDCIDDNDNIRVQETAMKLLLYMVQEEFLDEWADDVGWEKINMKSFDPFASPKVRRDALYFVMDQIEIFDTDGNSAIGDKKQSDQLLAIAKWCAIRLCDSSIPVDKMNIELVDYVVRSMVGMPEHRDLVLNWPMMFKAIRSENPQQGSADEREEIGTQRILLRMLATSAEIEFGKAIRKEQGNDSKKNNNNTEVSKKHKKSSSLDDLSIALLKNLPNLLNAFKSDIMSLRDVTKLPLTIASSVLGLPSRKTDFQNLIKTLCQLYIDSTDEQVLQNIAQTLSHWVEGDHTRVSEVKINMKRLSGALQERLMELFRESDPENEEEQEKKSQRRKKRNKSDTSTIGGSSMFSTSQEADTEHSISLLMLRWKILLMQCKSKFLFEKANEDEDEDEIEGLFYTISEAMGKRLTDRMSKYDREAKDDATTIVTTPTIWKDDDPDIHEAVSLTIDKALRVLLVIVSQELLETQERRQEFETSEHNGNNNMDMDVDEDDFPVLKMRDNLVRVLGLCFDQHLPKIEDVEYTSEQHEFSASVQDGAGKATSDLRTLFPSDWSNATDPVRRALALTSGEDFENLISGFVRWFQSREETMVVKEDTGSNAMVRNGLLPLARIINLNYQDFHRKEAGMLLKYIASGKLASQTILSLTHKLKKTNPLRMLEAYISCIKSSFENWVDNEPTEPEESAPSEEEIQKFEEAELRHEELFFSMEQVATKLSSTLGVAGRLSNDVLKKSICGFMREGIRFAFDGPTDGDDELVVGSRLAFLSMLQKFTNWVKKDKAELDKLTDFLIGKETELRRHPEFDEIHPDDLNSLADFRKSLGIKGEISYSVVSATGDTEGRYISMADSPASSALFSRQRMSTAGSRVSRLSGFSAQSDLLSPLVEEDDDTKVEDGDETSQSHRVDTGEDESLTRLEENEQEDDETTGSSTRAGDTDDGSLTRTIDDATAATSKRSLEDNHDDDESWTRGDDNVTAASKRSSEEDGSRTRVDDNMTTATSKRSSEDNQEDDGSWTRGEDNVTVASKRSSEDDGSLTRVDDNMTTATSKRSSEDNQEDDESWTRGDDNVTVASKRSSEDDGSLTRADDDVTAATSKRSSEDDGSLTRADDDVTAATSKQSLEDDRHETDDVSWTRADENVTAASKQSSEDDGSLTRVGDDVTAACSSKCSSEDNKDETDDGSLTRADDNETAASRRSSEDDNDETDDGSLNRADEESEGSEE